MTLLVSCFPQVCFAAEVDGLCEHHAEHTAECGYVEGEHDCTYHCDECKNHARSSEEEQWNNISVNYEYDSGYESYPLNEPIKNATKHYNSRIVNTVNDNACGYISIDKRFASVGETITVTANAYQNYELSELS